MIHRIVIENFMTHRHTVLELHRRVTVLTGPNNTGKSAVVEAIRCVPENLPSASLIRHGAAKAVVRLELDDGVWIQWERTMRSVLCRTRLPDGSEETYAKVGRGMVPDEIRRLLRLHSLQNATGPVDVHIGNQRTPIFPLDQSGSQVAGVFAASTEAAYLLAMQQALKECAAPAQKDRKRLQEALASIEKDLTAYDALPEVARALEEAERLYRRIETLRRDIPDLVAMIRQAENLSDRVHTLSRTSQELENLQTPQPLHDLGPLQTALEKLEKTFGLLEKTTHAAAALAPLDILPSLKDTTRLDALLGALGRTHRAVSRLSTQEAIHSRTTQPPVLFDTASLAHLTQRLDETLTTRRREERRRQTMQPLEKPPELRAVQGLARLTETMEALHRLSDMARAKHEQLASLKPPPEVFDMHRLRGGIDALETLRQTMEVLETKSRHLERLEPLPTVHDPEPLRRLLESLEGLHSQCEPVHSLRDTLEDQLKEKRRAVREQLAAMPLCPLCRQPMSVDHFLESAHA